jgi:hypothetical protein
MSVFYLMLLIHVVLSFLYINTLSNTQANEEQETASVNGFWAKLFPVALSTKPHMPEAVKPRCEQTNGNELSPSLSSDLRVVKMRAVFAVKYNSSVVIRTADSWKVQNNLSHINL